MSRPTAILAAFSVVLFANPWSQVSAQDASLSKQTLARNVMSEGPVASRADAVNVFRESLSRSSLIDNLRALDAGRANDPASAGAGARVTAATAGTGTISADRLKKVAQADRSGSRSHGALDFRLKRSRNGTVNWMHGRLGQLQPGKMTSEAAIATAAADLLDGHAGILKLLNPSAELEAESVIIDQIGFAHVRYRQTYRGVPVWGRDLIAHFDDSGLLFAINGTYEPTPSDDDLGDLQPILTKTDAINAVISDLSDAGRWNPLDAETAAWLGLEESTAELVVYAGGDGRTRLAYEVSVHSSLVEWFNYVVSAAGGQILNSFAKHCTLHHDPDAAPPTDVTVEIPVSVPSSGTFIDANGADLNGANRAMRVYQDDGGGFVLFADLDNVGTFALPNLPEDGGAITITAGNSDLDRNAQLGFVTSNNNAWNDASATSAHANQAQVYDYFKSTFGRRAINDADQSLVSVVHVTQGGVGMDNAYFNGRMMAYGDGNQAFTPLAGALDVAAHEMAHGVVAETAQLIYQAQSGALNESFADVFGVMVDRDDYLMGEDIMAVSRAALRDLENPANPQILSPQPAHMDDYENLPNTEQGDNGGVHINSGIPNRAAVIVAEAIGKEKTEQIYYRALSTYLTRNSQFGDARMALVQSAVDLHGAGSPEAAAVQSAFDAVGIEGSENVSDPGANDVPAVSGEVSIIVFVIADGGAVGVPDGSIAFIDPFDTSFIGIFSDPGAVARVGSQLSTPLDGTAIWFVNQNNEIAAIDLANVDASTVDGLAAAPVVTAQGFQLFQPGDIANVSIGPIGVDENDNILELLAIASAYEEDPTIYFTDLTEIIPVDLKPETTQQGIDNDLIKYPDVISWSSNPYRPKVAFDALNAVALASAESEYWSIYELDFGVSQIYNLIATQPADVSVGNIAYTSRNPDIVAFNVIEPNNFGVNQVDIYLANFETGQLAPLGLPSLSTPIEDGLRPAFAPDDAFMTFASQDLNSLLFLNLDSFDVSSISFTTNLAPFGPDWFIVRADVGDVVATNAESDGQKPTHTSRLIGSYPNPFTASTTLQFELDRAEHVRMQVFDILGRSVDTVADAAFAQGRHDVRFTNRGLAPGAYVIRFEAGGFSETIQIVVSR